MNLSPDRSTVVEARALLLDLVGPAREVTQQRIDAMDGDGWGALVEAAVQHRLLPMLHWQFSRRLRHLALPEGLRERCAAAHRESTLLGLHQQRDLLLLHRRLAAAGIAHRPMKGAFLAFHAFPEAGLRPMRDLDILVPADRAVETYELALASGAEPFDPRSAADPAIVMTIKHQLPALRLAIGTILEIHHEIFHNREPASGSPPADPASDPAFWERGSTRDLAGSPIDYMSPTDMLHNVVVHAVYDHEFDNGPLFLADIAWLLDACPIDWPSFWGAVELRGQGRGAALALRMMEVYWGARPMDWSEAPCSAHDIPRHVVEAAAQITLRDLASSPQMRLMQDVRDKTGLAGKAGVALRRLSPLRHRIAVGAPSTDGRALVAYYIRRWRHVIARTPAYLGAVLSGSAVQDLEGLANVRNWLRKDHEAIRKDQL
jgi:hypothetical protein